MADVPSVCSITQILGLRPANARHWRRTRLRRAKCVSNPHRRGEQFRELMKSVVAQLGRRCRGGVWRLPRRGRRLDRRRLLRRGRRRLGGWGRRLRGHCGPRLRDKEVEERSGRNRSGAACEQQQRCTPSCLRLKPTELSSDRGSLGGVGKSLEKVVQHRRRRPAGAAAADRVHPCDSDRFLPLDLRTRRSSAGHRADISPCPKSARK